MESMAVCELAVVSFLFALRYACSACVSAAGTGELDEGLRVNGRVRGIIKDYPLVLHLSKYGFSL